MAIKIIGALLGVIFIGSLLYGVKHYKSKAERLEGDIVILKANIETLNTRIIDMEIQEARLIHQCGKFQENEREYEDSISRVLGILDADRDRGVGYADHVYDDFDSDRIPYNYPDGVSPAIQPEDNIKKENGEVEETNVVNNSQPPKTRRTITFQGSRELTDELNKNVFGH
jgi:hypothetical protein